MGLKDDLVEEVNTIFRSVWEEREGTVVPDDTSLTLANVGVHLDATVLYADIDGSTGLVDGNETTFAAEVYKAFLHCAAKIIRGQGGEITAYDGDRVMAVFIGNAKNTSAARTALKLNYARLHIINPLLERVYGAGKYTLQQVVGVDASNLMAAKTGVRGANDLVWVGRAANHAAKLCELPSTYPSRITESVYDNMNDAVKTYDGRDIWERVTWTPIGRTIYRSTWWWEV